VVDEERLGPLREPVRVRRIEGLEMQVRLRGGRSLAEEKDLVLASSGEGTRFPDRVPVGLLRGFELVLLGDQAEGLPHLLDTERFAEVVERAEFHRVDRGFDRGKTGHHDHERARPALADLAQQFEPALARHLQVGEYEVDLVVLERLDRLQDRRGSGRHVAVLPEEVGQFVPEDGVVVHDQDAHGGPSTGRD